MAPSDDVQFGVSLPSDLDARPLPVLLDDARGMHVARVALDIRLIERHLGAPEPAVPLETPPADGLAFGLLELEEEVLLDSYALARETLDAHLRTWRTQVSLARLESLQRTDGRTDVAIDVVTVPDLVTWSDEELDYACRAAAACGARLVATTASLAAPRRIASFARRHGLRLGLAVDETHGEHVRGSLLREDPLVDLIVDMDARAAATSDWWLEVIESHADRIAHVLLRSDRLSIDEVDDGTRRLLHAMRDRAWRFPVLVDAGMPGFEWPDGMARAIDACHAAASESATRP